MKKSALAILLLLSATLHAQPNIEWQRCLGGSGLDEAYCSKQTSDGGFIIAGHTRSNNGDVFGNHGGYDAWLIKLNPAGSVEWKRCYGGSGDEWCHSVEQTVDGGYIFAGLTYSNNFDVSGNHGDSDAWVVKVDSSGIIQWQKCLGGSQTEVARCVIQTEDGGYSVVCRTNSTNGEITVAKGGHDFWVVKLDETGQIEWQKSYGGTWDDNPHFIRQTTDGGYILTGETFSINGDVQSDQHGDGDYWVVKLSSTGELEWERALGGSFSDIGQEVIQTSDGGYMVLGHASSGNWDMTIHYGGFDIWLLKLSPDGEIEWQKTLGGSDQDRSGSVLELEEGGFIVSGSTESTDGDINNNAGWADFWLVRLDNTGQILWERTFGGTLSEITRSMNLCLDVGMLLSGITFSNDGDVSGNHGSSDIWVVKLSPFSLSTTSIHPSALNVSPNPSTGRFIVNTGAAPGTSIDLQIFDLSGNTLHKKQLEEGGEADLGNLPSGNYFLRAITPDGTVYQGKVIKCNQP